MPRKTYPEFSNWLDSALAARRMKPADLVRDLDLDSAMVSRWRNGKTPSIDNLQRLADYFGIERALLEPLIGVRASTAASPQSLLSVEEQAEAAEWRSFYERMREEIPRPMWGPYRKAVEALAEPFLEFKKHMDPEPTAPTSGTRRRRSDNTADSSGANGIERKKRSVANEPTDLVSKGDNTRLAGTHSGVVVLLTEHRAQNGPRQRREKVAA
jgi:transcriptional regulator with XRE-family HTH domain